MFKKIHLLPLSIVIMSMILGVKVVDFTFGIEASMAQGSEQEKPAEPSGTEQDKTKETAGTVTESQKPDEEGLADQTDPLLQLSSNPTRKEIEYLQKLSQRRQELDHRSRELDDREKLLEAVEMRIVERTKSLQKIEKTITDLLNKNDRMEKAQLQSLVKMYSVMKPKQAAQIFNGLNEEVLIAIAGSMKESKMGEILAQMKVDKAKKLTTELANRNKLPDIEG